MLSQRIGAPTFSLLCRIPLCKCTIVFVFDPFICWWALRLLPVLGYCKLCCYEHWGQHKQMNKQVLERMRRKGNRSTLLVGVWTCVATVENSMEFPQKTKNGTALWPSNSTAGIIPKNPETPIQKNLCNPMFVEAQFTIGKYWKQPKCPWANEWIQKRWYIYTMEFYSAERKKELLPFATSWMELETIMLSEISHLVTDKHHMISLITGI